MTDNTELRYLVQAGEEINDDVKKQVFELLLEEGDMCCTVSSLYDNIDCSDRTVRGHIADSRLLERQESQGVSLVMPVNDIACKAVSVAESCSRMTDVNGLPTKWIVDSEGDKRCEGDKR